MSSVKKRKVVDEQEDKPSKKKVKLQNDNQENVPNWTDYEVVSQIEHIDINLSKTICKLFEEEHTIPFLCRYRSSLIQGLAPERLREIKETIDETKVVEVKMQNLLKTLDREKLLTNDISSCIRSAKTLEEIEHFTTLFKPPAKGSLYERAQKLGLESAAEKLLYGTDKIEIEKLKNPKIEGLKKVEEIETGLKNIISHLIAKNEHVMDEVRRLREKFDVKIISSVNKKSDEKTKEKFENYFDFSCSTDRIKPHQVLALNRGKSLKVLNVKYEVDERIQKNLEQFSYQKFMKQGISYPTRMKIYTESFHEAYKKKISTFIVNQTQSNLNKKSEKAAVESFAINLKNLLLTNPVKGQKILGIDPGFTSGCKLAMISETGQLLETNQVINLKNPTKASEIVCKIMKKFNCSLIAIGNATACRETEKMIAEIIKNHLKGTKYCIVSEQGASIYSCSEIAKKEFPKIEVQFLGAISIARRLQDPLCELVKIDPKHIGVGMYQHDINEKTLKKTLDEIVSECVSFVGVDLNTASLSLLKHVAGLTEKRAEAILKYREENGKFNSREELLKVKSIGPKIFTQCSGFTRVLNTKNLLDSTNVHPENYKLANSIIKECNLNISEIGTKKFIEKVQKYKPKVALDDAIQSTIEALSKELFYDYRNEIKIEQVFKQEIIDISSLKLNQNVTGVVMNICDFGAFVDIGVGQNGLIHISAMKQTKLKVSDKVECKILNVDVKKKRIGLEFLKNF